MRHVIRPPLATSHALQASLSAQKLLECFNLDKLFGSSDFTCRPTLHSCSSSPSLHHLVWLFGHRIFQAVLR